MQGAKKPMVVVILATKSPEMVFEIKDGEEKYRGRRVNRDCHAHSFRVPLEKVLQGECMTYEVLQIVYQRTGRA